MEIHLHIWQIRFYFVIHCIRSSKIRQRNFTSKSSLISNKSIILKHFKLVISWFWENLCLIRSRAVVVVLLSICIIRYIYKTLRTLYVVVSNIKILLLRIKYPSLRDFIGDLLYHYDIVRS